MHNNVSFSQLPERRHGHFCDNLIQVNQYVDVYTVSDVYLCMCIFVCMYIGSVCMYACIHVCVCTCICVPIFI